MCQARFYRIDNRLINLDKITFVFFSKERDYIDVYFAGSTDDYARFNGEDGVILWNYFINEYGLKEN